MRSSAALMFVFPVVVATIGILALYWVVRLAVRDGVVAANRLGASS